MAKEKSNKIEEFYRSGSEYSKEFDLSNGEEQNRYSRYENVGTREENVLSETKRSQYARKKKISQLSPFAGIVASLVAVVTVVTALPKTAPKITKVDFQVGESYYAYTLDVENPSDIDLKLIIFNDYFSKESEVTPGDNKGVVEGLSPDTNYKIAIKGSQGFGEKTFYTATFRTLKDNSKFETKVTVDYYSKGDNWQILYYKITINDFLGYYSNYQVFVDIDGVKKQLNTVGAITDEQCILLSEIMAINFVFSITVDTADPKDLSQGNNNISVFSANWNFDNPNITNTI
ncbi:MAG: hypothetical protein RR086_05720 [Clostridia bacterium]